MKRRCLTGHENISVLYEDNHLLVLNKPAGIATIGVREDELSLAKLAKDYLKRKYQKPGNVYLGVMSRLDRLVSGVVLFARTSKAAARLSEQFATHTTEKTYLAVTEGVIGEEPMLLEDWLIKNESQQRMAIVSPQVRGAQVARLTVERVAASVKRSLLKIQLQTGRKHQIRVQLSGRGFPVVGDRKYGSSAKFGDAIALHSARLVVDHPTRDEQCVFQCSPPASWLRFGFAENLFRLTTKPA